MTARFAIRPVGKGERAAWEPLWRGYQTFYEVALSAEVTDKAWERLHDPAEPMFILGNKVHGGLYGTYPSLADLDDNGDLKFTADFRSVYAGVLQDQVGATPGPIVGSTFDPLRVIA